MVLVIVLFSLVTVVEVWVVKRMGFDIFGHLKVVSESGPGMQFYLEAFGVAAFIMGQPIILTILLIWLIKEVLPLVFESVSNMFTSFFMGD